MSRVGLLQVQNMNLTVGFGCGLVSTLRCAHGISVVVLPIRIRFFAVTSEEPEFYGIRTREIRAQINKKLTENVWTTLRRRRLGDSHQGVKEVEATWT